MAKIKMIGLETYIQQIRTIEDPAKVCRAAVRAGAGVIADGIRQELESDTIAISDKMALAAYQHKVKTYCSESQKKGMLKGLGISKIRVNKGVYEAKVGFDGYNDVKTKRWPHGQPNALIAQSVESGRTWMIKQPFVRPTVKRLKGIAELEMKRAADQKLKEILGGNRNG